MILWPATCSAVAAVAPAAHTRAAVSANYEGLCFSAVQVTHLISSASHQRKGILSGRRTRSRFHHYETSSRHLQALIAGDLGYTTALGSTMRCGIRGLPLRVVMTIADKPLFALIARPGINSVDELRGKLLGFHPLAQAQIALARAVLRRYKINPNGDLKILALDGGTIRIAAMETGAIDAALIEAPYNLILERKGFGKILFVGDIIPTPLAGFNPRIERFTNSPMKSSA
jgi:ABC-type taurine transport system substrate-binding protein